MKKFLKILLALFQKLFLILKKKKIEVKEVEIKIEESKELKPKINLKLLFYLKKLKKRRRQKEIAEKTKKSQRLMK
jgi:hypothetical protein